MNRSLLLALPFLAACGHPLWPTSSAISPVTVSTTYQCADSVSKALGYRPYQAKPTEGFLRTRKGVTAGLASVFDQVAYDQLKIEVATHGTGSTLDVTAESYIEQVSRRGREETERPAREEVIADARSVVQACGATLTPPADRVPNVN